MTAPNKMAKRAAAGTLALAVCLAGGVIGAGAASADINFSFDTRIAGDDRFGTAIAASKAAFPTTSESVVIANGNATVDGLSASYVAGITNAPILYTSQDSLSAETLAEITRLGAKKVYVVGGLAVVSQAVEDSLKAVNGGATVTRYGGQDRFLTAALVAKSNGTVKPAKVLIASGTSPADALALGPIAFKQKYPVVLTDATSVPGATSDVLAELDVDDRIAAGGTTVISESTATALGVDTRLAGDDRQGTAIQVRDYAIANEGFSSANVALVGPENQNAADALVAAPLAAKNNTNILFAARGGIGEVTGGYLLEKADELTGEGYVFGGTTAVPVGTTTEADVAAQGGDVAPGITVLPEEDEVRTVSDPLDEDEENRGIRQYAATVGSADAVDIFLFDADDVDVTEGGVVSFADDDGTDEAGNDEADFTATGATIEVVNGVGTTDSNGTIVDVEPVNGIIAFTIDSEVVGDVIPVVVESTEESSDADPNLAVGADNVPTAEFGTGGATSYVQEEADSGAIAAQDIVSVDKELGVIAGELSTFFYDESDRYYIDGSNGGVLNGAGDPSEEVTAVEFEEQLSEGDRLVGESYQDEESLESVFVLLDTDPIAPTLTVEDTNATSIEITVDSDEDDAEIEVYLAEEDVAAATPDFDGNDIDEDFELIATLTEADDEDTGETGIQYTIDVAGDDTAAREFSVAARQIVDDEPSIAAEVNNVVVPIVEETDAPTIENTEVTVDGGTLGILDDGDTFILDFNEEMDADLGGTDSFVRVSDSDSVYQVSDGVLGDGDSTTAGNDQLTFEVTALNFTEVSGEDNGIDLAGDDVTITLVSNDFDDRVGNQLDLAGSGDVVLDDEDEDANGPVQPPVDNVDPFIASAELGVGSGAAGFNTVNDTLIVNFSEPVTADASILNGITDAEEADLEAILGTTLDLAAGSVVTATATDTDTITFTVTVADLTEGVVLGDVVDGTPNAFVQDTIGNTQVANPGANPTVAS